MSESSFHRRIANIRDRVTAQFNRIIHSEGEEVSVLPRLQNFSQNLATMTKWQQSRRRRRVATFKVTVFKQHCDQFRSSAQVHPPCSLAVPLHLTEDEFGDFLRTSVENIPQNFELCRVNGQRVVLPLREKTPAQIKSLRLLNRSALYIRPLDSRTHPEGESTSEVAVTEAAERAPQSSPTLQENLPSVEIPGTSGQNQHGAVAAAEDTSEVAVTEADERAPQSSPTVQENLPPVEIPGTSGQNQHGAVAATEDTWVITLSEGSDEEMECSHEEVEGSDEEMEGDLAQMSEAPPGLHENHHLPGILSSFQAAFADAQESVVIARRKRTVRSAKIAMDSPNFLWNRTPSVEFVGEMGEDLGGPRREFLRLLIAEVNSSLGVFEGKPDNLLFTYNLQALADGKYHLAGKLAAWSIFHNGPGPRGINKQLFQHMCGQKTDLGGLGPDVLTDEDERVKMEQVWKCLSQEDVSKLKEELGDWVASCGVPEVFATTLEKLPVVRLRLMEHFLFHRTASMIRQYIEGFNSCGGFWEIVQRSSVQFQPVFCHTGEKLTRNNMQALFKIKWSVAGSNRRESEEETIFCWACWLRDIHEGQVDLTLQDVLVFVTGADAVPTLGFEPAPAIDFFDQVPGEKRLPYASTCALVLFLPRGVEEEKDFRAMMDFAIKGSLGFGKV